MNEIGNDLLHVEMDGILKASNDNIVIADGDGQVLKVSPNCEVIYGESQSYLVGKSVFELEKEDIFVPSVTARVLKERKDVQLMQRTVSHRVVMATGIPIYDDNKNIIRIISFSHDLTEIHKLREDYEQLQVKMQQYQSEIAELKEKDSSNRDVVVKSKKMKRIMHLIKQVAKSDATVLLTGETGVGKNVFAQPLHDNSERKEEQLIEVNCGAVPPNLFESEMFGYEAGSFTGANKKGKAGLIEMADQGTLFLDEIGELPLEIQVKLLQVLQNKKVARIGGNGSIEVDFRLVVATNQNLENKVKKGEFRQDLFYRLNVIPVEIPSLRERKEDIYQLMHHYLSKFNEKYQTNKILNSTTVKALINYDWPGNVRELENLLERLVIISDSLTIYPPDLPFVNEEDHPDEDWSTLEAFESRGLTLLEALEEVEQKWLRRAYQQYKSTYEMAEFLGLSQPTIVRRLN
ncbi:sigma 54-interacting transcriptional regulator [Salicibibacter cibarius]|uniref:HTH-type transcriptional regulatory protein TyrR n=1 Tax=Salicibibacter cibarius TaxID=2743000 RepID=A0A7T6Z311_9BACI|nr:sigma 54-interacting transcriptional regulator [Salicibibacter cibarius]QQK75762.1 sigma 54-interacting transcriptional regulator [Salicibibacter cibarius]